MQELIAKLNFDDKKLKTIGMTIIGIIAFYLIWDYYSAAPWTRDGKVRVDVIALAPDVSGRVVEVLVHDNQFVKENDVLFIIDQARLKIQIAKTEATVKSAERARDVARRENQRYSSLKGIVSEETRLARAAAEAAAEANYLSAVSERDLALLNLDRSTVRAPAEGYVTNFSLRPGAYVNVGSPVLAFVASKTIYVAGYFEETKLSRIKIGAPVNITLMGESGIIKGKVQGITYAVEDRERATATGTLLPNVNPTFSWIRLPQRVPVRVEITEVPVGVHLVAGRTATVEILD